MSAALAGVLGEALTALTHPVGSVTAKPCSGAALLAMADRVAAVLRGQGVMPDEPVHLRMGNRPTDIAGLLGIWRAGAVAVPVHVTAAPTTIERLGGLSRARFLVDGEQIEEMSSAPPPARALAQRRGAHHVHLRNHRRAERRGGRSRADGREAQSA